MPLPDSKKKQPKQEPANQVVSPGQEMTDIQVFDRNKQLHVSCSGTAKVQSKKEGLLSQTSIFCQDIRGVSTNLPPIFNGTNATASFNISACPNTIIECGAELNCTPCEPPKPPIFIPVYQPPKPSGLKTIAIGLLTPIAAVSCGIVWNVATMNPSNSHVFVGGPHGGHLQPTGAAVRVFTLIPMLVCTGAAALLVQLGVNSFSDQPQVSTTPHPSQQKPAQPTATTPEKQATPPSSSAQPADAEKEKSSEPSANSAAQKEQESTPPTQPASTTEQQPTEAAQEPTPPPVPPIQPPSTDQQPSSGDGSATGQAEADTPPAQTLAGSTNPQDDDDKEL